MRVICAYGTRPEKIKTAPVVDALRASGVEVIEWVSGQSKDLVDDTYLVENWSQGLPKGLARTLMEFSEELEDAPDCVIVQGDTATAFACAQAAFLARVPVAHVEAGLRTYQSEPWPEEAFRRQIAAVARWHFCPDEIARQNILSENYRETSDHDRDWEELNRVHVVGNTVIDTLPKRALRVLVTLHRRENWGTRRKHALRELIFFGHANKGVEVTIVRHPNGASDYAEEMTEGEQAYWLVNPMPHDQFLSELRESDLVVTDSGGLQEEAAHMGVACLVLRTATERVALARCGAVEIVDPDAPEALREALERHLARRSCYGDGTSGEQIARILVRELSSDA